MFEALGFHVYVENDLVLSWQELFNNIGGLLYLFNLYSEVNPWFSWSQVSITWHNNLADGASREGQQCCYT